MEGVTIRELLLVGEGLAAFFGVCSSAVGVCSDVARRVAVIDFRVAV